MFRALLVDDELPDLEWLKRRIDWQSLEVEIAGAADNGYDALALVKDLQPDLLITDIRMPMMSGLELANQALTHAPAMKVVFISGFQDFQYAKKAIDLNAIGYIIKPIDNDELIKVVRQSVDRLKQDRQQVEERRELETTLPLVRHEMLLRWLEEREELPAELRDWTRLGLNPQHQAGAALLEIDDVEWKLRELENEAREQEVAAIQQRVQQVVDAEKLGYLFTLGRSQMVLLWQGGQSDVFLQLETIIRDIREHSPLTMTVGIGETVISPAELPDSYAQAKEALAYKMFIGKSRIITQARTKGAVRQGAVNLDEKIKRLCEAIETYRLVDTHDLLEEIFAFIQTLEAKTTVYNVVLHVVNQVDHYLRQSDKNLYDILQWQLEDLDVLFQFQTVEDIQTWLRRKLFELSELLVRRSQTPNRRIIAAIEDFVTDRLGGKITMRDVADHLGFSPGYLGFLFKEETGVLFSDFLVRKRLEKACELLMDPKLKVYEVTESVGYRNIIYFNRQFKDVYGITPTEFRRRNRV